ncbi:AAA family ATPase [Candidatus Sumerlaeota bacterium]|nr:AAA family ATPase [Candidatus Sumerlaeota bacterium]
MGNSDLGPVGELTGEPGSPPPQGPLGSLETGIKPLDELLGGLRQGLCLLIGSPSCGKTTLLNQLADQVALFNSVPVLFFSYQHSFRELRVKTLSRMSKVPTDAIAEGMTQQVVEEKLTGQLRRLWEYVDKANRELEKWIHHVRTIEADGGTTVGRIQIEAEAALRETRAAHALIAIDPLEAVPLGHSPLSREERLATVCAELRRVSRALDCPVVATVGISHDQYKGNRLPSLGSLRDRGGIEHLADAVMALWEDQNASRKTAREIPGSRAVDLLLLKNRHGALGRLRMQYNPALASFSDAVRDSQPYDRFDAMQG